MKRIAVIFKDGMHQSTGLIISMAMLSAGHRVQLICMNHEISVGDNEFHDFIECFDSLHGERFSNNAENIRHHGFKFAAMMDIALKINQADVVINLG